jgi:hypothetical protein
LIYSTCTGKKKVILEIKLNSKKKKKKKMSYGAVKIKKNLGGGMKILNFFGVFISFFFISFKVKKLINFRNNGINICNNLLYILYVCGGFS